MSSRPGRAWPAGPPSRQFGTCQLVDVVRDGELDPGDEARASYQFEALAPARATTRSRRAPSASSRASGSWPRHLVWDSRCQYTCSCRRSSPGLEHFAPPAPAARRQWISPAHGGRCEPGLRPAAGRPRGLKAAAGCSPRPCPSCVITSVRQQHRRRAVASQTMVPTPDRVPQSGRRRWPGSSTRRAVPAATRQERRGRRLDHRARRPRRGAGHGADEYRGRSPAEVAITRPVEANSRRRQFEQAPARRCRRAEAAKRRLLRRS